MHPKIFYWIISYTSLKNITPIWKNAFLIYRQIIKNYVIGANSRRHSSCIIWLCQITLCQAYLRFCRGKFLNRITIVHRKCITTRWLVRVTPFVYSTLLPCKKCIRLYCLVGHTNLWHVKYVHTFFKKILSFFFWMMYNWTNFIKLSLH